MPNPEAEITAEDYRVVLEFILKLWYLWGGVKGDFGSTTHEVRCKSEPDFIGKVLICAQCGRRIEQPVGAVGRKTVRFDVQKRSSL